MTEDFNQSFLLSKELFNSNSENELYAEIYFSLASELNILEEFTDSEIIIYSDNKKTHMFFYQNYMKLNSINLAMLKSLLPISIKKFPQELFFTNLLDSID